MKRRFRTRAEENAYALGLADAKPPDGPTLTVDDIKAMSTEEAAERLDEINAVLTAPVTGGGGDDS